MEEKQHTISGKFNKWIGLPAKPLTVNKIFSKSKLLNKINIIPRIWITVINANSLGINFKSTLSFWWIHHFPKTHQLLPRHINFLKAIHYVIWMKGFSCQNDFSKQASKTILLRHGAFLKRIRTTFSKNVLFSKLSFTVENK